MEYVSSDTNVWIDFCIIDRSELPFCLHDRIALAIAKERDIILLTGDGELRKAPQA